MNFFQHKVWTTQVGGAAASGGWTGSRPSSPEVTRASERKLLEISTAEVRRASALKYLLYA